MGDFLIAVGLSVFGIGAVIPCAIKLHRSNEMKGNNGFKKALFWGIIISGVILIVSLTIVLLKKIGV